MTVQDLVAFFEAHVSAEEKRPATVLQYGSFLRRFDRYLQEQHGLSLKPEDIGRIKGLHLSAYLQELAAEDRTVSTRNNYIVILKRFFSCMKGIGMIKKDPSQVLHCVKEKKTPEVLEKQAQKRYTAEEVKALIEAVSGPRPKHNDLRDAAIIALILGSGLRAFEVCALNISQMEGIRQGDLFCLRKGGNWAHVSVADFVAPCIDRYLNGRQDAKPDDPLFLSQKGNRLDRKTLWKSLAAKQQRLNLKTGVHIFRHTLLTAVDQAGGSAMARDVGGHSTVYVTNRYVHTSMEERQQAVSDTPFAETIMASIPQKRAS